MRTTEQVQDALAARINQANLAAGRALPLQTIATQLAAEAEKLTAEFDVLLEAGDPAWRVAGRELGELAAVREALRYYL